MDKKSVSINSVDTDIIPFKGDLNRSGIFQTAGVQKLRGIKWKLQTGNRIFSSPVIFGDSVFIGSDDSKLYSINKFNG